jgi:hypothetical protein
LTTIQYLEKEIQVSEIFREDYGFILYEGLNGAGFFLDVLKNHSAAYWSEQHKITEAEKEELLKTPSYFKALEISARYKK